MPPLARIINEAGALHGLQQLLPVPGNRAAGVHSVSGLGEGIVWRAHLQFFTCCPVCQCQIDGDADVVPAA